MDRLDINPKKVETLSATKGVPDTAAAPGLPEAKPVNEIQQFTDSLVRKALLWMFPYSIRPNHLTVVRFILTPMVLLLFYYDLPWWALGVFVVAFSTDFIDGAMARTRDQITPVGIVIDPIADKLLVGTVLAWVGWDYLVVKVVLIFIALELILTAVGLSMAGPGQRARPANAFGKVKMIVQSLALTLFLVASILELDTLLTVSLYLLWVAVAFAAVSGSKHILGVISNRRALTKT